jgi:hypothetical protein
MAKQDDYLVPSNEYFEQIEFLLGNALSIFKGVDGVLGDLAEYNVQDLLRHYVNLANKTDRFNTAAKLNADNAPTPEFNQAMHEARAIRDAAGSTAESYAELERRNKEQPTASAAFRTSVELENKSKRNVFVSVSEDGKKVLIKLKRIKMNAPAQKLEFPETAITAAGLIEPFEGEFDLLPYDVMDAPDKHTGSVPCPVPGCPGRMCIDASKGILRLGREPMSALCEISCGYGHKLYGVLELESAIESIEEFEG